MKNVMLISKDYVPDFRTVCKLELLGRFNDDGSVSIIKNRLGDKEKIVSIDRFYEIASQ